jgi:shikimate kinase
MRSNIALIGFMGTGKSAAGRILAEKLNKKFIEMDSLIEQRAGRFVAEIFQQDGEVAFRELEIEITKEISQNGNQVIACGGGVVLNKINIDRLAKDSVIVYLTALPGVILKRLADGSERPLLNVADPAQAIEELLRFREPFYGQAADFKVDTSKMDVNSVAEEIIRKLTEDEGFS